MRNGVSGSGRVPTAVYLAFLAMVLLRCGGDVTGGLNVGGGGSGSSAGGTGGKGGAAMAAGAGGTAGTAQGGAGGGSAEDGGTTRDGGGAEDAVVVDAADTGTRDVGTIDSSTRDVGSLSTPCQELLGLDPSGLYYASCLPKDLPVPIAFAVSQKVTSSADATMATIDLTLTSLKTTATTISDTSGSANVLPQATFGADCTYTMQVGRLTIPADANSLGRDLVIEDVVLRGKLQTASRSCAELDGTVPLIMLSLQGDGDICVLIRTEVADPLPAVSSSDYVCPPR
jgi:hypothetical protein